MSIYVIYAFIFISLRHTGYTFYFVIELTFHLCRLFLGVMLTLLSYLSAYQSTYTHVIKDIVLVVITIFAGCQHAATHFHFENLYRKQIVVSITCKCEFHIFEDLLFYTFAVGYNGSTSNAIGINQVFGGNGVLNY